MNEAQSSRPNTRNLVGQIPDPDELYGRRDFIDYLWQQIRGNNILLLAPRRFGKSGVMRHVLLRPEPGYLPLSFELEDVDSPEEFVWRITRELLSTDALRNLLSKARGLPSTVVGWIKETFDEAEFEGAKLRFKQQIKADWREAARRMLIELEKADSTIIFLFDELPAMLDLITEKCGRATARDFLAWFRTVRLAQKDVLRRHRFIVAGSIGLDIILRKLDATDKLVDFARLYVKELEEPAARELAADLAALFDIAWGEDLNTCASELLGAPVPHFIHVLFSQLGQLPPEQRRTLTATDLQTVYGERLLGPTCRHYFDHYRTRLKRYGKTGEKAAFAVLRSVAGLESGRLSRSALYDIYRKARGRGAGDTEFDELLADMEHDWYLRLDPATNEYYFLLKVMRDWWRRWYPSPAQKVRKPALDQP
jgi:hypothetical protein